MMCLLMGCDAATTNKYTYIMRYISVPADDKTPVGVRIGSATQARAKEHDTVLNGNTRWSKETG